MPRAPEIYALIPLVFGPLPVVYTVPLAADRLVPLAVEHHVQVRARPEGLLLEPLIEHLLSDLLLDADQQLSHFARVDHAGVLRAQRGLLLALNVLRQLQRPP